MTDDQFIDLMAKLDSLYMLVFVSFLVIAFGVGWLVGAQR
jgi:hypothetical protein